MKNIHVKTLMTTSKYIYFKSCKISYGSEHPETNNIRTFSPNQSFIVNVSNFVNHKKQNYKERKVYYVDGYQVYGLQNIEWFFALHDEVMRTSASEVIEITANADISHVYWKEREEVREKDCNYPS